MRRYSAASEAGVRAQCDVVAIRLRAAGDDAAAIDGGRAACVRGEAGKFLAGHCSIAADRGPKRGHAAVVHRQSSVRAVGFYRGREAYIATTDQRGGGTQNDIVSVDLVSGSVNTATVDLRSAGSVRGQARSRYGTTQRSVRVAVEYDVL